MDMLDVLLDPSRRAKAAEEQESLREKHGRRVVTDPALATFFWGVGIERTVLEQLQSDDFSEEGARLLKQLADAYAAQARFDEAAALVQDDTARQARYLAYAAAIHNIGTRQCNCPATITYPNPHDAKGHVIDSLRDVLRASDGEHVFALFQCRHCDAVSAYFK